MPGEDLSDGGYAGFFGKLPATGDFVGRGLPAGFRARWDRWVTRHLAGLEGWPEGGLRFRLLSGGRSATGLVLPSRDAVGRRFPLTGVVVLPTAPPPAEADAWCGAALPLLEAAGVGTSGADALWEGLEAIPRPPGTDPAPAPLLLWTAAVPPIAADPADPADAIAALLSSGGSSSP